MKHIHLIAGFFILMFISCSKSNDSEPSNSFATKGKSFELTNGFISDNEAGAFRVVLADGVYDTISQLAGHSGISLFFKSPEDSALVPGEYVFTNNDVLGNREFMGDIYLYDSAFFAIDSGSVVVEGSGTNLDFDIQVRYNNIQSLTGIYSGSLSEIDEIYLPSQP